MKQIGESTTTLPDPRSLGLGVTTTVYEVEVSDVGQFKQNFLGYRYRSHLIKVGDVGRQMHVHTCADMPGWTCWNWKGES
jgi:hypothetical protein